MTIKEAITVLNMVECHDPLTQEAKDRAIMSLKKEVYWEDVKQTLNGWLNNTTSPNEALNDIYRAYMGRLL